jgi:hypothetical protein
LKISSKSLRFLIEPFNSLKMSLKSLKIVQNAASHCLKPKASIFLKCFKKASDFLKSLTSLKKSPILLKMFLISLAIFEKPSQKKPQSL